MAQISISDIFVDSNGEFPAAGGTVTFRLSDWMTDTSGRIVIPVNESATISAVDGTFSIALESTTTSTPGTRSYAATFSGTLEGTSVNISLGSFSLAPTPASQDLSDLLNTGVVAGTAIATYTTLTLSHTEPRINFYESDAGTDLKWWDFDLNATVFTGRTRTDADGAGVTWLSVVRGATTAVTSVALTGGAISATLNATGLGIGPQTAEYRLHVSTLGSTSAVTPVARLENTATATANGQGASLNFVLTPSGGARQDAAEIAAAWSDYTGTGVSVLDFYTKSVRAIQLAPVTINIGTQAGNSGSKLQFLSWTSTKKNWQIGQFNNFTDDLEFTPSTAAGGFTFSTATLRLGPTYLLAADNAVTLGDASNRFSFGYFGTSVNVGLATNADGLFYSSSQSGGSQMVVSRVASADAGGSIWSAIKTRGTQASPGDVVNGDEIFRLNSGAYSGGTVFNSARISYFVDGTFTTGQASPSRIEFYTNVANGAQTLQWGINAAGLLFGQGQTSSFPALKRSSTELQFRLADDSAFAPTQASIFTGAVGSAAAPTYTFAGDSDTGSYRKAAGVLSNASNGIDHQLIGVAKTLDDNTVTTLFTIDNDADTEMSGGAIEYTVTMNNGVGELQVETGVARFVVLNDGGVQAATITKYDSLQQLTSGTLTVTFSVANDAAGQLIRVTVDSSLNSLSVIRYHLINNSVQAITLS